MAGAYALSAQRYPTGPAEAVAWEFGLAHPDVGESFRRWSRYLRSHQEARAEAG